MAKWLINPEILNIYPSLMTNDKKGKNINLDIAYEIKRLLEKNGEKVLLTRSTNTYVEDKEKIELISKWQADYIITLNVNEDYSEFTKIYVNNKGNEEGSLAKFIKSELISNLRTEDKGIEEEDFYVLKEADIPSIIIIGSYLSSNNTEELVKKYGELISKGCLSKVNKVLLDLPKKNPKTPKREGWRICLGYYRDYEDAEEELRKLKNIDLKEVYIVPYPEDK